MRRVVILTASTILAFLALDQQEPAGRTRSISIVEESESTTTTTPVAAPPVQQLTQTITLTILPAQ